MAARKRTTDIPMHQLEVANHLGLWVEHTGNMHAKKMDDRVTQAHSDDHYIFFLLTSGALDFKIKGWFVAVDTALVDTRFRAVFENKLLGKQMVSLDDTEAMEQCLSLIKQYIPQAGEGHAIPVIHHLIGAFLGMAACHFSPDQTIDQKYSGRAAAITSEFRQLVSDRFITHKTASDYAALMNISTAYLNEVLQQQTGASSTYWIQQETMLAAKRLLYHTDLTVKEIAHRTGFADHAYFSRLFQKTVCQTPLTFRSTYRESSNSNL